MTLVAFERDLVRGSISSLRVVEQRGESTVEQESDEVILVGEYEPNYSEEYPAGSGLSTSEMGWNLVRLSQGWGRWAISATTSSVIG